MSPAQVSSWLLAGALLFGARDYRDAVPGYRYSFPKDHFDHPDFRTEWWYYTGNLRDGAGKRFGFELVFFRFGDSFDRSDNRSTWRVDDLYLAHAAITDIDGRRFYYTERMNRAGPGIAGASVAKNEVWNGNWTAHWDGERQTLTALADDFAFTLHIEPAKPLVIHGVNGISQKADRAGKASCYVSFTRLRVVGNIRAGQQSHSVSGTAWMDHEWFSEQLDPAQIGWDWFSIQLENQTELMLFDLRRKDGSLDSNSSGTFIDNGGRAHHLTSAEFSLHPKEYWTSPKAKAHYPVKWSIHIPSLHLDLDCVAVLPEQELLSRRGHNSYWEGAVIYSGTNKGTGYLEMTGYDKPVRLN